MAVGLSLWLSYLLYPAHVGEERVGDEDGAVGLLVVFDDGGHGAPYGESRAVQGVDEFGLFLWAAAEFDVRPPRLIVKAVGAGRDLPIAALRRHPNLDVVGLGRGEAHVPRAERHDSIGEV